MTTLSASRTRAYTNTDINGLMVPSTTTIYSGAAVGKNAATGKPRALQGGDQFLGFARSSVNHIRGQEREAPITLVDRGQVGLVVSGAVEADIGKDVYATDDDTFTLSSTGASFIGVAKQLLSAGKLLVEISPPSNLNVVRRSSNGTALVSGDEILLSRDSLSYVTNPTALKPVTAALLGAVASSVLISGVGDSLMQLGGDTTNQSSDQLAEQYGFLACLRRELNARMGLSTYDGGQWCPPSAAASDTRVANGGTPTLVAQYAPYSTYRDSSGVQQERKAVKVESGKTITYTVTGRYLDLLLWDNTSNGYNGTIAYTIDGGGSTNITSPGGTDSYRIATIDMTTQASHTVVISWVSANMMVAGALVRNAAGIATARFAVGSTTAANWAVRLEREIRTSFKTLPAALQIIRFSYNDWSRQVTDTMPPETFATNLQTLITAALVNTSTKGVLLLSDPATSATDDKPRLYSEYTEAAKALATGSVAFMDLQAAMADWTTQDDYGWYVDFVHHTASGFAAEARLVSSALLSPSLLLG